MKKLLSILFFTFITNVAMADQLAYLTYEQAEESLSFLQNEERVVLWCACCDDDAPTDVFVESFRIESVGDGYYEIILTGSMLEGESIETAIDLAYVHVLIEGDAYCFGTLMGYECAPCTEVFEWE
jgi:hypothetical protein